MSQAVAQKALQVGVEKVDFNPCGAEEYGGCALDNQGLVLEFCFFFVGLGLLWVGFGLDGACFGVACCWL